MLRPQLPSEEQLRDLFDVELGDLLCAPEPVSETAERKTEVKKTLTEWAEGTGHTGNLYPRFEDAFSACITRSTQFDRDIENHGEVSAEISLSYMAQSMELWQHMMKLTEGTDDE